MNTVLPFYYQIMQIMKSWIINKEFNPGEKIPSENQLAKKFGVSRLTLRKAISNLVREGFLYTKRGNGTYVINDERLINRCSYELHGFMDDLFLQNMFKIRTKSVVIRKIAPPKVIREKLCLDNDVREVIRFQRVRILRDNLSAFIINYLPVNIGQRIPEKELYHKPLLRILEEDLKIEFGEAVQTVEATFADQEVAEKLQIVCGCPVLFVERVMYSRNREPVELFQAFYRGDLYKIVLKLKNVKRKGGGWVHTV